MRTKRWIVPALIIMLFVVIIALCVGANSANTNAMEMTATVVPEVEAMAMYEPVEAVEEVIEAEPTYPLTQEEIDLIALVTMGEAEGETELGKRLVIDTILNRMEDSHFPDTVHDVIYQPNQFSVMWCERINRCYVMPEIVELVKEELLKRTNYDCVFFMAGGYSKYGEPMFQECCHYFSSYD